MQARADLIAVTREVHNETFWIVKDPLRLSYFCYTEQAYFVLRSLLSKTPFETLAHRFETRFGTPLSDEQFKSYLLQFTQDQLIALGQGQDGSRLATYGSQPNPVLQGLWRSLANPLAIRLPGWNFSPVFKRLQWLSDRLVHPLFLLTILVFGLLAIAIVAINWSEFQSRLPSAQVFFQQQNILLILFCLGGTKILHEFGHALACRKWGAECHEIGVMFLLFSPCMYCDVSDAWMVKSKWKRISIAAAGILVELFIASWATIIWWYSEPGWLNSICLNLMVICGVNTVLFNGNPFLRFDGYFILSDLLEIPNLWSRSRRCLKNALDRWLFNIEVEPEDNSRQNRTLLIYAIFSAAYRLLLIATLFFLIVHFLISIRFEILALLFTILFVLVMVVVPIIKFSRRTIALTYHGRMSRRRLSFVWGTIMVLAAIFFFMPLPHHVSLPGYVEPADVERIYIKTGGILKSIKFGYGNQIQPGQTLLELENPDLELSLLSLTSEYERNQARLERLESTRAWNPKAGDEIPAQMEKLQSLEESLTQLSSRQSHLNIKADLAGQVMVPFQNQLDQMKSPVDQLPYWIEKPLSPVNIGAWFEKGQMVALIGKSRNIQAFALVRQEEIDLIRSAQKALVMIAYSPRRMASGEIQEVSLLDQNQLPKDVDHFLSNHFADDLKRGEIESGKLYLARISIDEECRASQFESAKIRIRVANSTLATRLKRYVKRTFASMFD